MKFIVRGAEERDLEDLLVLSKQFKLLNLKPRKETVKAIIELSRQSFLKQVHLDKSRYLFVLEDTESGKVVGSSQIKGKNGTEEMPHYSFKVRYEKRFSEKSGAGFIHELLCLKANTQGSSEIGGLILDKAYRKTSQGVGKLISLCRFLYIAMFPELFTQKLYVEMAPALEESGRNPFWESLGFRFTDIPYDKAHELAQIDKEFIQILFPKTGIYLNLLDPKARLMMGTVGKETKPALSMLLKWGFDYNQEVDPFDGGPHLCATIREMPLMNAIRRGQVGVVGEEKLSQPVLVGYISEGSNPIFFQALSMVDSSQRLFLSERTLQEMNISEDAVCTWILLGLKGY